MISENSAQPHDGPNEEGFVGETREGRVAMDNFSSFFAKNVSHVGDRAYDGWKDTLVVDGNDGEVVDLRNRHNQISANSHFP